MRGDCGSENLQPFPVISGSSRRVESGSRAIGEALRGGEVSATRSHFALKQGNIGAHVRVTGLLCGR